MGACGHAAGSRRPPYRSMVMGLELHALLCRLSDLHAQSSAASILFGYLAAASRATDNGTPKDKSTATISSREQASGVNPAPSMRGKFLERELLPEREKEAA